MGARRHEIGGTCSWSLAFECDDCGVEICCRHVSLPPLRTAVAVIALVSLTVAESYHIVACSRL